RDAQSRHLLLAAGVPPARVLVSADPAVTRHQAAGIRYQELRVRGQGSGVRGQESSGDEQTSVNSELRTQNSELDSSRPTAHGPRPTARVAFCVRDLPNNPKGGGLGYLLPVAAQRRLGLGGRGQAAHGRRAAAFYGQLAAAADHLIERYGVQVLFVPFWPGRDDAIAAQVQGQMRYAAHATGYSLPLTPAQARALLGTMDLVVAVRLHALIFAAAAGVPGIGFAYARKIRGFMAHSGQAAAVLDPATLTLAQLTATLDRVWAHRAALRVTLTTQMAELQALADADAAWVRAWLES
ncbi:MAG: polysaccharide pyruvyl transferase family protein, partial [Chloroflexota bacterium]|nr:polysaccharide pyruvyl transferase family protein [Chloroflexota bacterium]